MEPPLNTNPSAIPSTLPEAEPRRDMESRVPTAPTERGQKRKIDSGVATSHAGGGYGVPLLVPTGSPRFPETVGSTGLQEEYMSLGLLGKGTFASIHKMIFLRENELVAVKVEEDVLFHAPATKSAGTARSPQPPQGGGPLENEAAVLEFLYQHCPSKTVPRYYAHYKIVNSRRGGNSAKSSSNENNPVNAKRMGSALVMEYLPGQDMSVLREQLSQRNVHVQDAIYWCADVFLPLLRRLHKLGIVHRDVKPSNCVRYQAKEFLLVDFGLSKSFVVPQNSPHADHEHPWPTDQPHLQKIQPACYKRPREKADFRGTSMYASLKVHELYEYTPRDDLWSLLYVFCDLCAGGLPWRNEAANRDRVACHTIKAKIHATENYEDLLKGEDYHMAVFRGTPGDQLPEPLPLSKDTEKVDALRTAFEHLQSLSASWDEPDYDLIQTCLRSFQNNLETCPDVPRIIYPDLSTPTTAPSSLNKQNRLHPIWSVDGNDRVLDWLESAQDMSTGAEAEEELPLYVRYLLARMHCHVTTSPAKRDVAAATQDFCALVSALTYEDWDAKKYEGGHRTSTDGFRRDRYLGLLEQCWKWAEEEFDFFVNPDVFFASFSSGEMRTIYTGGGSDRSYVHVSRIVAALHSAISQEKQKRIPPPTRLLF